MTQPFEVVLSALLVTFYCTGLYAANNTLPECASALSKTYNWEIRKTLLREDLMSLSDVPPNVILSSKLLPGYDRAFVATPYPASPTLYSLEPVSRMNAPAHERRTAKDYAKFLAKRGLAFVYIGEFDSVSVPIFDGIILDARKQSLIAAVSLKFATLHVPKVSLDTLVHSLRTRLDLKHDLRKLATPEDWFFSVTGQGKSISKAFIENYSDLLWRTRALINIFGLFQNAERRYPEIRTVIDMRDHGYPFEYFKQQEVQEAILNIVGERSHEHLTLTLLWNDQKVIEFNDQSVQIFDSL